MPCCLLLCFLLHLCPLNFEFAVARKPAQMRVFVEYRVGREQCYNRATDFALQFRHVVAVIFQKIIAQ